MPLIEFVRMLSEGNKITTVMLFCDVLYKLQVLEMVYSKVVKHIKKIPRTTKLRYCTLAVRDNTYR